jgi:hypothetical protein
MYAKATAAIMNASCASSCPQSIFVETKKDFKIATKSSADQSVGLVARIVPRVKSSHTVGTESLVLDNFNSASLPRRPCVWKSRRLARPWDSAADSAPKQLPKLIAIASSASGELRILKR